jgi:pre-mRNA-splicing helicase BRR2
MADPNNIAQYRYSAMSNLVLQADRRFVTRRGDEVTGDPESLAGRINIRDMGSRNTRGNVQKKKTTGPKDIQRGGIREGEDVLEREKKRKRGDPGSSRGFLSAADANVEGLRYRPRTPATRQTYDLIVTTCAQNLGDVPHEVVRSAADAVLEFLKDENLKDFDKKKEIDDLLASSMSSKEFNELVNLGKKITDYAAQDDDDLDGNDKTMQDGAELDEKQGVAVVFDDSEEDDDEGGARQYDEVRDDDASSDEDADDGEGADGKVEDPEAVSKAKDGSDSDAEELIIEDTIEQARPNRTTKAKQHSISAREIDAFWLQRQIGAIYSDAHAQQTKTQESLRILAGISEDGEKIPLRETENDLMDLFDYEHHELVEKLIINQDKVVWVTRWRKAAEDSKDRADIEREMESQGLRSILDELRGVGDGEGAAPRNTKLKLDLMDIDVPSAPAGTSQDKKDGSLVGGLQPKRLINLENLIFDQGNHLMTNSNVKLPQGSTKRTFNGYEEIHVPAPKPPKADEHSEISASVLPDWARPGFGASQKLNRIQTKCYPTAFNEDSNMLICAPTGSGKTNVAMLAILREIGKHRNPDSGEIMLDDFKIVYIAPLKALVQEQVGNFGKRLESYGIKVSELTGDRQLTKQQIADTQIIVTTPEKWDVITRKATDMSYTNLVRLIVIDEIHLLHDDRGPVIESIVSRTIRKIEQTGDSVRLVGLSATLPNYRDVASFLRVDPLHGLFHFDGSFRPCPLQQEFIGVTDKKAIKQLKTMNDVCYTKVMDQVGSKNNQILIFVHSRKETAKTAKYIRDKALELETIGQILRSDAASREILTKEAEEIIDRDLKDLLPYGFGIHHAGMNRADRTSVEELFGEGLIQVLVCTATLAWGVNLPAHAVIIKGTQIYSPEKGS